MGKHITTAEAAEILGVIPRRIVQLVEKKLIKGEKFGKVWMIEEQSVRDRAAEPIQNGRPKLPGSKPRNRKTKQESEQIKQSEEVSKHLNSLIRSKKKKTSEAPPLA